MARSIFCEMVFDLTWAGALIWLGRKGVRPPGLFALYVAGYSGFRIFEEMLRIDYSQLFIGFRLGFRLHFFVAGGLTAIGLAWFAYTQLRGRGESVQRAFDEEAIVTDASPP